MPNESEQQQEQRAAIFRNSLAAEEGGRGEEDWTCAICAFENRYIYLPTHLPACGGERERVRWRHAHIYVHSIHN